MWTLDEAVALVRVLQPETRQFNYRLTLGGSVLNHGTSLKDLDLYFLPLDDQTLDPIGMLNSLRNSFGVYGEPISTEYPETTQVKFKFIIDTGQRIDVFIWK